MKKLSLLILFFLFFLSFFNTSYGQENKLIDSGLKVNDSESINTDEVLKQYLGLFTGSLGVFGIELTIDGGKINPSLDDAFNASLYFRQKSGNINRYILGLDLGTRLYKAIIKKQLYIFAGFNVGIDYDSYGGPGFMFGPTRSEIIAFVFPSFGFMQKLGSYTFFGEIKPFYYDNPSVLLKLGFGIN